MAKLTDDEMKLIFDRLWGRVRERKKIYPEIHLTPAQKRTFEQIFEKMMQEQQRKCQECSEEKQLRRPQSRSRRSRSKTMKPHGASD